MNDEIQITGHALVSMDIDSDAARDKVSGLRMVRQVQHGSEGFDFQVLFLVVASC